MPIDSIVVWNRTENNGQFADRLDGFKLSVLDGDMPAEKLLQYREYHQHLPGHPERNMTPGVKFSSGRLGHMWAFCNGVAMANPGKAVVVLGSDGSQMEGDNAEAARLSHALTCVAFSTASDADVGSDSSASAASPSRARAVSSSPRRASSRPYWCCVSACSTSGSP